MPEISTAFEVGDLVRHMPTGYLVTVLLARVNRDGEPWYVIQYMDDETDIVPESDLDFPTARKPVLP